MNTFPLILFFIVSLSPAMAKGPKDPFAPQGKPEWHKDGIAEKPYQLEIAYGETKQDFRLGNDTQMGSVNSGFLENATNLKVATSSKETGELEKVGDFRIRYKLLELNDGSFDLRLIFESFEEVGRREMNTNITLRLSEWVVLGGMTQQEGNEPKITYLTAVRLKQRTYHP